jgi:hypothetical protein
MRAFFRRSRNVEKLNVQMLQGVVKLIGNANRVKPLADLVRDIAKSIVRCGLDQGVLHREWSVAR